MEINGPELTQFANKKYLLTFLFDSDHPKYPPDLFIKGENDDLDQVHDVFKSSYEQKQSNQLKQP